MCNANNEIMTKVQDYIALKKMSDDLAAEMDALADEIKSYMDDQDADTMTSGDAVVTYKPVVSKRIDTVALKKLLGDALEPYFKTIVTKRFSVK